jgi:hypothetical protein
MVTAMLPTLTTGELGPLTHTFCWGSHTPTNIQPTRETVSRFSNEYGPQSADNLLAKVGKRRRGEKAFMNLSSSASYIIPFYSTLSRGVIKSETHEPS